MSVNLAKLDLTEYVLFHFSLFFPPTVTWILVASGKAAEFAREYI